MKQIKLLKNRSDIGAGTRGSDLGVDAIEIAAINQGNHYFNHFEFEDLETINESIYNKVQNSFALRIKDVLKLKLYETLFIALFAFFLGVILAYIFVFIFGAPLFRDIFLGFGNLTTNVIFQPVIEGGVLGSLFLFFILPFTLSVLIPVWRIAIIEPYEGMK